MQPSPTSLLLDARSRVPGPLQKMPDYWQKEAHFGIQDLGFGPGKIEEERIETIKLAEKASPFTAGTIQSIGMFTEAIPIPTVLGDFRDAVTTLNEVLPKLIEIIGTGIPPFQADDSDPVIVGLGFG